MKQHTRSILVLSVSAALTMSNSVMAEDGSSIDTMTILGQTYRNTATKTSLDPEETPQAINIIDSQQFEHRNVNSLGEILQYTPGVTTDFYGADANFQDYFTIRGFDVSKSYYNGTALQTLSGWSLQPQIDPIAIEQVEVFKGPTSVLYGATPPGGMVNLIAKSPQVERRTKISAGIGSDHLKKFSIDTTGQIGDSNFNYRLIGLAEQSDTQTSISGNERYVFAPSIDWNISDQTLLNVNLYYQNDPEAGNNTSMTESILLDNDVDFSLGDKNWTRYEREFLRAGYKFQHEFNNQWTFLQSFNYTTADFSQQNSYLAAYDETTADYTRALYGTEETSKAFEFDNQLSATFISGDVEHNVLLGADIQKLDGTSLYSSYGTSIINVNNPNYNLVDSRLLTEFVVSDDGIHSVQKGLYIQDQIEWDNLVIIAGLRYDQYKAEGTSYGADYENDSSNVSYRIGGLYTFDNGLAPFASYSTSFEPLNTAGYDPEIGRQIELGLKYNANNDVISGSVALFNIEKSNVVTVDPSSVGTGAYTYIQLGEVTSQGVEFESKLHVTDSLDIAISYTYMDVEVTEDTFYKGTTPIFNPEHTANLWADYSLYNGLLDGGHIGAGVRYVGEMEKEATNTQGMVPDYTVVDLSLGYDLSYVSPTLDGASVNFLVSNLFDKRSYVCYSEDYCWNNAGLATQLNVNYTF